MIILINEISELIKKGDPFSLATIIRRNGSAPRSTGAKMLVRSDGSIAGTIGGGALEAQVIRMAVEALASQQSSVQSFSFSGVDAASMDAICGGQVDVLIETVPAQSEDRQAVFAALKHAVETHRSAWLLTTYNPSDRKTSHAVVLQDGQVVGSAPQEVDISLVQAQRLPHLLLSVRGVLTLIEPANISGSVFIFGAGHVSQSLAQFTKAVGFWTMVLDDRSEFANRERFPDADEIRVLSDMQDISSVPIDEDSYVVIVTRGHLDDLVVLAQVLRTPAAYIGMIGSRRKVALIFDDLRKRGFSEEALQRVRAPIGLSIAAETPEEIGISITAQLIQERAAIRNRTDH